MKKRNVAHHKSTEDRLAELERTSRSSRRLALASVFVSALLGSGGVLGALKWAEDRQMVALHYREGLYTKIDDLLEKRVKSTSPEEKQQLEVHLKALKSELLRVDPDGLRRWERYQEHSPMSIITASDPIEDVDSHGSGQAVEGGALVPATSKMAAGDSLDSKDAQRTLRCSLGCHSVMLIRADDQRWKALIAVPADVRYPVIEATGIASFGGNTNPDGARSSFTSGMQLICESASSRGASNEMVFRAVSGTQEISLQAVCAGGIALAVVTPKDDPTLSANGTRPIAQYKSAYIDDKAWGDLTASPEAGGLLVSFDAPIPVDVGACECAASNVYHLAKKDTTLWPDKHKLIRMSAGDNDYLRLGYYKRGSTVFVKVFDRRGTSRDNCGDYGVLAQR